LRFGAEGVILLLTTMLDTFARESWQLLGQKLGAYIGRRLPAQEVDDVLQDVLLRIHKNIRYLSDDSRFGPWVYSVARNAVIDRLRKKQPAIAEAVDLDTLADPKEAESEQALLNCVTPFVARLPEAYRHAITLVELEGLTQAEAATIAGVSLSGMKSRVQRGRRLLREMFEECCSLTIDARGRVIEAERHDHGGCDAPCSPEREAPVTVHDSRSSSTVRATR
jgi:RNA polymerase sigma-70 factor, ECF subfamily